MNWICRRNGKVQWWIRVFVVDEAVTEADETSGLNVCVERNGKVKLGMYEVYEIVDRL